MSEFEAALVTSLFRKTTESQRTFELPFNKRNIGVIRNSEDVIIDEINAVWKLSTKFTSECFLQLTFEMKKNKDDGSRLKKRTFNVVVFNDGKNLVTTPDYFLPIILGKLSQIVKVPTHENKVLSLNVTVSISACTDCHIDTNAMCRKIASNNLNMLIDPTYSDFTFIAEGQEFNVHKNILAVTSPVFAKLFTSNMREASENKCEVADIRPFILEHMLRFIYGAILPPDIKNISMSLYEAAHYYDIKDLMDICKNVIHSNLTAANAHAIYAWATLYDLKDLKSYAMKLGNIVKSEDAATSDVIKNLIAQKQMDLAMLKRIDRKRKC